MNKVILIGNLGQDPEKKTTPSGDSVVNFSLATTEKWTDKQGNKQERTEWNRCCYWGKQADVIAQYCKKGSKLGVVGSLQTREWTDKDGNKRFTTEIKGKELEFLDSKPQQGGQQGGYNQQGNPPQPPNQQKDFVDDDIPF